jgi:hypothetical protein
VAMRQLSRGYFLRMRGFFFFNISILFEDIFRKIEAFFNQCEGFSKIARLFKDILIEIEAFLK